MKNRLIVIASVLLVTLWYYGFNYWDAHWHSKWAVLLLLMSLFVSVQISKQLTWALGLPVFWTLCSGLYIWAHATNIYYRLPIPQVNEIKVISAMATAMFLLFILFFKELPITWDKYFRQAFAWSGLICTWGVFISFLIGKPSFELMETTIGNGSMGGCYIAACYPFILNQRLLNPGFNWFKKVWNIQTMLLPILAIFMVKASIPIGMLGLVLTALCIKRWERIQGELPSNKSIIAIFSVCSISPIFIGYLLFNSAKEQFFNSNQRFEHIRIGWNLLKEYGLVWTGFGLNLTTAFLPFLCRKNHPSFDIRLQEWWIWFHSDIFQLVFDLGIIGFISYGLLYIVSLFKSFKDKEIFASLAAFFGFMLFNYPMHCPLSALLFGFLIWSSNKKLPTL